MPSSPKCRLLTIITSLGGSFQTGWRNRPKLKKPQNTFSKKGQILSSRAQWIGSQNEVQCLIWDSLWGIPLHQWWNALKTSWELFLSAWSITFGASKGWPQKFKDYYNIISLVIRVDYNKVSQEQVSIWLIEKKYFINLYGPELAYNCDEIWSLL